MNRFLLRSAGALAILGFFLAALSCAHDQQLVSISVEPTTETSAPRTFPCPPTLAYRCSSGLSAAISIPR
jgi:hypothetical protein